jgi:hypothetical protein
VCAVVGVSGTGGPRRWLRRIKGDLAARRQSERDMLVSVFGEEEADKILAASDD